MKPADGFDEKMPVLDAQASSWPGFSWQNWSEFIRNSYVGYGVTATDAGRFAADIDTCEAWPSDANKSDGDSLNGPINSPNVPTVLDARGCNLIRFKQASTIVLNEDLTILVKDFRSSKGLQVVKGPLVPSGKTPTLRIVLPMENSATECVANAHDGVPGIRFDSGGASSGVGSTILGADVSLMLYSAGTDRKSVV